MAYQGKTEHIRELNLRTIDKDNTAEKELENAVEYWKEQNNDEWLGKTFAHYSLSALLSAELISMLQGSGKKHNNVDLKALEYAYQALEFAEKDASTRYPLPRDFIQAYWLLGEALIQCDKNESSFKTKNDSIHFYDEYFQHIQASVKVKPDTVLEAAERCITEALQRCRKVNLVEFGADILITNARLLWIKHTKEDKT